MISYSDLAFSGRARTVGIDLTGSERRPSGWCLLDGPAAVTRRIGPDEELVRRTVDAAPALVSLDSPLGLPRGRTSVFDDDPARRTHGIMRECERVLRRRGIPVYLTLLPSMQRLTRRGIALAGRFRELGLPVIESYPGGAQDLPGHPPEARRAGRPHGGPPKVRAVRLIHDPEDRSR